MKILFSIRHRNRKGMTPVISKIIMLLVTISLAGVAWIYLSGQFEIYTMTVEVPPGGAYCRGGRATVMITSLSHVEIDNSDSMGMLGMFPVDNGMLGLWHLDEQDGNATFDSSGKGNHGSIYGDSVLIMRFDGGSGNTTYDMTSYGNNGYFLKDIDSAELPDRKSSGCQAGDCIELDGVNESMTINTTSSLRLRNGTVAVWFNRYAENHGVGRRNYVLAIFNWSDYPYQFGCYNTTPLMCSDITYEYVCYSEAEGCSWSGGACQGNYVRNGCTYITQTPDQPFCTEYTSGVCEDGPGTYVSNRMYIDFLNDSDMMDISVGARYNRSDGSSGLPWPDIREVPTNEWHSGAFTWEAQPGVPTNGTYRFYFDGELNYTLDYHNFTMANYIHFGAWDDTYGYRGDVNPINEEFYGSIDEVAMYDRPLSDEEMMGLYEEGRAVFVERGRLGRYQYGMEFDGRNDYIDLGSDASFNGPDIALAAWIRPAGLSGTMGAISKYDPAGPEGYVLGVRNGRALFAIYDGVGSECDIQGGVMSVGEWYHIIGIYNDTSRIIQLYVDGVNVNNTPCSSYAPSSVPASIGKGQPDGWFFDGAIDEAVMWNRALSQQEIQDQIMPTCSCSGATCTCGDLIITKTAGEGHFHPYFNIGTIPTQGSARMMDYSCMDSICTYRVITPAAGVDADAVCS